MVIDFQQLYNQLLNTYNSFKDITTKLKDIFINPTPQDVPVKIIDENGNPTTVNIPNLSKWKQYVWNDALSAMYRTVYVDQVNGDDNNPGTSDKPFKTISKAISTVPTGGYVRIELIGDYELESLISVYNKHVLLIVKGILKSKYIPWTCCGNEFSALTGFDLTGNFASLDVNFSNTNAKWIIEEKNIDKPLIPPYKGAISFSEGLALGSVNFYVYSGSENAIEVKSAALFNISEWSYRRPNVSITLCIRGGTNIVVYKGNNAALIDLMNSTAQLNLALDPGCSIKDENGNTLDWKDVTHGIIRDSNGVPRNVTSNIIF